MKTSKVDRIKNFSGTVLVPLFETKTNDTVTIEFDGLAISPKVFTGKKDSYYLAVNGGKTYVFIGLGKTIDYKSLKTIFRRIAVKEKAILENQVVLNIPEEFGDDQVEAAVSGLLLGTYNLGHFKNEKEHPFLDTNFDLKICSNKEYTTVVNKAIKIAKAQLETLSLVDLPPNTVTPRYLATWAQEKGNRYGFEVKVLGLDAARVEGLGAFLAVGKASQNEPQFVIMTYTPKMSSAKLKHIGLVGKGITFDTGGLNIKTAGMVHMKCDMAGGAAVFGAMQLIADLQLPVQVTAIVPCAENAVDKTAFLPSDVIQSYSGHSIEIIDTDAEGRLVLADGLSYLIKNYKPEYIVDIATLTGSSVGTFGYECGALFTNNDSISKKIQEAGDAVGERLWPLPLWDSYKSDIASDIADVKNYSGKPVAGAISAAKFLEFFTQEHTAWAHLDVAGVAFGDDEFAKSKHATAYGVHLLTKFIENL
ncbi:leucyl aminopeptidase family protein [Flavobacterium muglaense]|uniref:Leucyl aminopeptidase family protein n=1 Tax=Flavobacterium muglaense TaxID=2764716 RepID=A0A923MYW3_9FLAO|nr:leucyl aminopeptidase family protein [Flavobacterium muglaense]MBC5837683.1 leucyl aminopeptidase family protein [Flavobacterium muglaense]MBC5844201.1 leucyl aminopeptidase family protein [Flavobacterium muglaense]